MYTFREVFLALLNLTVVLVGALTVVVFVTVVVADGFAVVAGNFAIVLVEIILPQFLHFSTIEPSFVVVAGVVIVSMSCFFKDFTALIASVI